MPVLVGAAAALFRTAHPWGLLCIRLPCRDLALRQRASASDGDFVCTVWTYERNRGLSRRGERRLAGLLARIFARRFCLQQRRNGPSPFPLREG